MREVWASDIDVQSLTGNQFVKQLYGFYFGCPPFPGFNGMACLRL